MTPTRSCEAYIDGASHGNPGPAGIGVVFFDPTTSCWPCAKRTAADSIGSAAVQRTAGAARGGGVGGQVNPVRQVSHYIGETTNNVAEYTALIYALQEALHEGCTDVTVKTDSELLVRQLSGRYKVRDPWLRLLHGLVLHAARGFVSWRVEHVPRTQNRLADRLAGQAARKGSGLR